MSHFCREESRALTQSLVLWDVFKAKVDVPKNPVVTNSSSPIISCPGAVGISQGRNTPWFGSRPKHSQGHLLPLISSMDTLEH